MPLAAHDDDDSDEAKTRASSLQHTISERLCHVDEQFVGDPKACYYIVACCFPKE